MMQIVDSWRGKKTVVYITHRMHLNDFADSVVMLRKDGTVEQGTHQQLSRNYSSKYYELWHEYLARKTEDLFEGKDSEAVSAETKAEEEEKDKPSSPSS